MIVNMMVNMMVTTMVTTMINMMITMMTRVVTMMINMMITTVINTTTLKMKFGVCCGRDEPLLVQVFTEQHPTLTIFDNITISTINN